MSELKKVRVQLLNAETEEVEEEVDVLTCASCVTFEDGETFQQKLDAGKLKGDKGDAGATGAKGDKGDTGATGQKGSQWYSGTGITGTSTTATVFSSSGVASAFVNDMYLNPSTGAVYKCTVAGAASAAKWVYAGSIKGATGAKGDKGDTGATGAKGDTGATGAQGPKGDTGAAGQKGSQWYSGTGITGTSTTATVFSSSGVASAFVNDMYLNPSTGAVYKCTVAGAASAAKWVYTGSIKGATGATGAKGDKGDTGAQGPKGADGDSIKVGTSYSSATSKKIFLKVVG